MSTITTRSSFSTRLWIILSIALITWLGLGIFQTVRFNLQFPLYVFIPFDTYTLVVRLVAIPLFSLLGLGLQHLMRQKRVLDDALKEATSRYDTLVESVGDAIFIVDDKGRFRFANKIASERIGRARVDLIGKRIHDVFPPAFAETHWNNIRKVLETGISSVHDSVTVLQGQELRYHTRLQPVCDKRGRPALVLGVARDLSRLADVEGKLESERDFTHSLVETANSLILCLDRNARITMFNAECERVTGYRREEVLGQWLPEIFLPKEYIHEGFNDFGAWVRQHPQDVHEGPFVTKSGEVRTVLWSNSSTFGQDPDDLVAFAVGQDITERKKMEEAYRESEFRFRQVLEHSRDVLYRLNLDCRSYDYVSASVTTLLGYEPDEIIAMGVSGMRDLTHPEDLARLRKHREELARMTEGDSHSCTTEYRIKSKTGRYRWLSDSHCVVYGNGGRPRYIIGSVRDITEWKKAEAALRDSEHHFRVIAEITPTPVAITSSTDGTILYANSYFSSALGFSADEVIGRKSEEFFARPEDRQRIRDQLERSGRVRNFEMQAKRPDGSCFWVVANVIRSKYHDEESSFAAFADISELKSIQKALSLSEKRYRELFDSIREGVALLNRDGQFEFCNPSCAEIFEEGSLQTLVGKKLGEFACVPGDPNWDMEKLLLAKGDAAPFELSIETRTGAEKTLLVTASVRRSPSGDHLGHFVTLSDITDRKIAQTALRRRLAYEKGLSDCSQILLQAEPGDEAVVQKALGSLLWASDACRVYLFENFTDPELGLCMRQTNEICAGGVCPEIDNEELQHLPYAGRLDRFRSRLEKGLSFSGLIEELEEGERAVLEPQGIQSILVLPVFVGNSWYGFVGFDDTRSRRQWRKEDIRLLGTAAQMIGAFVERRRSELTLRRSETRYRLLVENVKAAISVIDERGEILFINEFAARDFGILPREFIGRNLSEFFPDQVASQQLDMIRGTIEEQQEQATEMQIVIADQWRWFDVILQPYYDWEFGKHAALVIANDITERKRETDRERARLQLLNDLRQATTIDECLRAGCLAIRDKHLFDRAVLTLHNKRRDITHIGHIGLDEALIEAARRSPAPDEAAAARMTREEFRISQSYFVPEEASCDLNKSARYIAPTKQFRGKEDAWRTGDELFTPIYGNDDSCEGWLSVDTPSSGKRPNLDVVLKLEETVNIVTRKVHEMRTLEMLQVRNKALRESEERLRQVIQNMPVMMAAMDKDSRIVMWNHECERVTGYSINDFDGVDDPIAVLCPQDDYRMQMMEQWKKYGDSYRDWDWQIRCKDGSHRLVSWSSIADTVSIPGWRLWAIGVDITERRMAVKKLQAASRERYEQARRIAGAFAHEIRNALFPAAAAINKLKSSAGHDRLDTDKIHKYAQIAERAITNAAETTQLISAYTKLEREKMPERIELSEAIEQVVRNNQIRFDEQGIAIDVKGNGSTKVISNRRQLVLALNNLIVNSVDALSRQEQPRITIGTREDETSATVTIQDNGSGIPAEAIDHIFEPFFSTKSDRGGAGIGLAVAHHIVEMYGGEISASNRKEGGTRFSLTLRKDSEDLTQLLTEIDERNE